MKFSDRLDAAIKSRGLSIKEICKATNLPKSTVHNWLNGCTPRKLEDVKRLADFLGIPVEDLLIGSDPRQNSRCAGAYPTFLLGRFRIIIENID